MRLYIEGPVNKYYVQTLCMIFFPGAKFSDEEEPSAETPALWVSLQRDAVRAEESGEPREGVTVRAKLCFRGSRRRRSAVTRIVRGTRGSAWRRLQSGTP